MKLGKENYEIIHAGKKTIAIAHCHGKVVRGVAVCSEQDEFNPEIGEEVAIARCNFKIAKMKRNYFRDEYCAYVEIINQLQERINKISAKYGETYDNFIEAGNYLESVLNKYD